MRKHRDPIVEENSGLGWPYQGKLGKGEVLTQKEKQSRA